MTFAALRSVTRMEGRCIPGRYGRGLHRPSMRSRVLCLKKIHIFHSFRSQPHAHTQNGTNPSSRISPFSRAFIQPLTTRRLSHVPARRRPVGSGPPPHFVQFQTGPTSNRSLGWTQPRIHHKIRSELEP